MPIQVNLFFDMCLYRLYNCELNGSQTLVKTWSVGPPSGSPLKIPTHASLGETAVDFDFATPTIKPDIDTKNVKVRSTNTFFTAFILFSFSFHERIRIFTINDYCRSTKSTGTTSNGLF